jgi:hypothetical protein
LDTSHHFAPLYFQDLSAQLVPNSSMLVWYHMRVDLSRDVAAFRIQQAALLAGVAAMIEPMSIYWSGLLMSDVVFGFLMSAAFYLLLLDRPYLSSAFLGLAALTRPLALYLAPIFVLMIFYRQLAQRRPAASVWRTLAITLMVLGAVLSPWYVRNKLTFDRWALSASGWYLVYNFPLREFVSTQGITAPSVAVASTAAERFDFTHADLYRRASLTVIAEHPVRFATVYLKRSLYSFVSNRYSYLLDVVISSQVPGLYAKVPAAVWMVGLGIGEMAWLAIYGLSLLAFAKRGARPWWLFFAGVLTLNALLSGGINPVGTDMSRYMLPFYVGLFAFAAIGLEVAIDHLRRRTAPTRRAEPTR